jgi:hypothetical protein
MLHSGLLFGLFFILEAGGDMFLRNVSCLSTNYTVYIPEDRTAFRRLHGTTSDKIDLIFPHGDELSVQKVTLMNALLS